jgi:hypothetical protein
MPAPDKLTPSNNAWQHANDQHQEMMLAVRHGATPGPEALKAKTALLALLHENRALAGGTGSMSAAVFSSPP